MEGTAGERPEQEAGSTGRPWRRAPRSTRDSKWEERQLTAPSLHKALHSLTPGPRCVPLGPGRGQQGSRAPAAQSRMQGSSGTLEPQTKALLTRASSPACLPLGASLGPGCGSPDCPPMRLGTPGAPLPALSNGVTVR